VPETICPLHAVAAKAPDTPALIHASDSYSYAELDGIVSAWATHLSRQGIGAGTRVAIVEPNRVELIPLLWALFRLHATAVLIDPRFPVAAVGAMCERAGATHRAVLAEMPSGSESGLPEIQVPSLLTLSAPAVSRPTIDLDQPATVIFTSGSTGAPKAALHSFGNHYFSALGSNENIALDRQDRWLLSLPLVHVGGLAILFRCATAGAAIVMADPGEDLTACTVISGATHLSLVPTQLGRILYNESRVASLRPQLKAILIGGAPASRTLMERAVALGLPVYASYGLTEMASQVATGRPDSRLHPRLLPYRELRMAADGEILVRGNTLFKGYVDGTALVRPVDAEDWFHTGDIGRIESDGVLAVLGRKDNMFISGGENIHPERIEDVLGRVEGISQAVVVPVDDPEFGRRPVAFVRYDYDWMLKDAEEYPVNETVIVDVLKKDLPRFMLPVAIYPWPESYQPAGLKADRAFFSQLARRLRRR